jgi:hypothetical protein
MVPKPNSRNILFMWEKKYFPIKSLFFYIRLIEQFNILRKIHHLRFWLNFPEELQYFCSDCDLLFFQHDAGSCVPTSTNPNEPAGNYIMFASATSGDRSNNNKFSECSIRNMTNVLDAVLNGNNGKINCFVESEEAFCGNAIREEGEVCDCGFLADCNKTDSCCYHQESDKKCTLKPHAECRYEINIQIIVRSNI